MRDIKFRVWNMRTKEMSAHGYEPTFYINDIGDLYLDEPYESPTMADKDTYTLMQYTGLKDKNGKEIYEGDVVRFYFTEERGVADKEDNIEDYTEMVDEVRFKNGCFYFICHDIGMGAFAYHYNDYCEVIGNIYENPELLK